MAFNLVDNPWIPCKFIDGTKTLVSFKELFNNAGKIEDIDSDNPLVNGSLFRLLIAIIHRAINGPAEIVAWNDLWSNDEFQQDILLIINSYLEKWYDRFFVFHKEYPFYQVSDLNETKVTTIAILAPQLASGANATLFNHCTDKYPMKISIDKAIRWVIAIQNFALGGLNTPYDSVRFTDCRKNNKSATGAPLAQAALVIIIGKTLYKTLLLNLHRYNTLKNIPYKISGDDKPIWERNTYTLPEERMPNGLVDWLTYQPRAIKLVHENGEDYIKKAILMVGEKLPKTEHRRNFETMVGFKKIKKSKGKDPFTAINFTSQKAVWRDINVLLQINEDQIRPKTMNWISDLIFKKVLNLDYFSLQLFGAISSQASFLQFKYESLPFNPQRLHDNKFMNNLNENLQYVEDVGKTIWAVVRIFFIIRIPDIYQKLKSFLKTENFVQISQRIKNSKTFSDFWNVKLKKNDKKKLKQKIDDSYIITNFWNQAEIIFQEFLSHNLKDPNSLDLNLWEEKYKRTGVNILRSYFHLNNLDAQSLKAGTIAIKIYFMRLKND